MDKITRTYFSFNTREGACPACEGLGKIHSIKKERVTDESLSLEDGAVRFFEKQYGKYQCSVLKKAFAHYGLDQDLSVPAERFSREQKAVLYEGADSSAVKALFPDREPPKSVTQGRFEGIYPILWRRLAEKNGDTKQLGEYFDVVECPRCKGERLGEISRKVTVRGIRLPELSLFSLEKLYGWVQELRSLLTEHEKEFVDAYLLDIETKLGRFMKVGLGYLSLDRQILTLSGGEGQRLKLAKELIENRGNNRCLYLMDEPTTGLHPRDIEHFLVLLDRLTDAGNTVVVVEHNQQLIRNSDWVIDLGPEGGEKGGFVIFEGTPEAMKACAASVTAKYL